MAGDYADRRRQAIEEAAFELLAQDGYKATSMLAIARRAKASNETLYNWYGNKQELFRSLVTRNTESVNAELDKIVEADLPDDPLSILQTAGFALLAMLTSERAIALNRAAAGDVHDTGMLGQALGEAGREAVFPRLVTLFERLGEAGALAIDDARETVMIWIALLVGDIQIRVVTGARPRPSSAEIAEHCAAVRLLMERLAGPRSRA